jgi:hypothetical protein
VRVSRRIHFDSDGTLIRAFLAREVEEQETPEGTLRLCADSSSDSGVQLGVT